MTDETFDSDGSRMHRRTVLRGVAGATGTLALGTAATAPALAGDVRERLQSLRQQYGSTDAVRRAVADEAGDLLRTLARNGVLDDADAAALPLDDRLDRAAFDARDAGVAVTGVVEHGEPTARIAVGTPVDDGLLHLNVHPELGRSYAAVMPDADAPPSRTFVSSADAGTREVTADYEVWNICRYEATDGGTCVSATLYCYPNDCQIYNDYRGGCTECYLTPCDIYCTP